MPAEVPFVSSCLTNAPQLRCITVPGAAWIRLHFSTLSSGTGAVILFDGARTGLVSYEGGFSDLTTEPIHGDSAFVYPLGPAAFTLDRIDAEMPGASNHEPVARTDGPASALVGDAVVLSADGDPLTFSWRVLSAPEGSNAAIDPISPSEIRVTPDTDGAFAVVLTASDATSSNSTLTWIVTRKPDDPGCNCDLAPRTTRPPLASFAILGAVAIVLRRRRH